MRQQLFGHLTAVASSGVRLIDHYNAPLPGDRLGIDYQSDRYIDAGVVDDALIAQRARFYLCGPPAMMDSVIAGLVARGVPRFDIFSEVFRSPAAPPTDGPQQFDVRFARSGRGPATWTPAPDPVRPGRAVAAASRAHPLAAQTRHHPAAPAPGARPIARPPGRIRRPGPRL